MSVHVTEWKRIACRRKSNDCQSGGGGPVLRNRVPANRLKPCRFYLRDRVKMAGRRRPTADLKLHDGKVYASQYGDRSREPQPTGKPTCPRGLSPSAKSHWAVVVPSLIETGVATLQDQPALQRMCEFWGEYEAAKKGQSDRKRLMMMIAAHRQWVDLASRFGLTPSDRARIVSDGTDKKRNRTSSHLA
jgi:phage terminase small subunit